MSPDKFALYLLITVSVRAQDPVANLIQGRVVGIKAFLENSALPIEIYYGIPYAAPPIGRLRFSPPERHMGWKKTYFAHRMPPGCPQFQNESNYSSENCLYLNIWTSRQVDGRLQPVIVILYSYSWSGGSLNLPCQELAAEGVVVVTVAYRSHLLSFFSLKSVIARGNLALLDQYMALLWVRENISAFGGDPAAVTVLGHSAGAESVLYHIFSPRTMGLFNRAILMSPNDIWKGIKEESNGAIKIDEVSRNIAHSLGCSNSSDRDNEILECMRTKPLEDIFRAFSNTSWFDAMQPISDNFLPETIQYLPYSLSMALKKSPAIPLDLMLGTTDLEALNLQDIRFKSFFRKSYDQILNFTMEKVLPDILHALSLQDPSTLQLLEEAVRWQYWSLASHKRNDQTSLTALEALATMDSAVNWGVGSFLLAEKLSTLLRRVYVYRYSYPTQVDLYGNHLNVTGAMRGTDLIALLGDAMMLQVARRQTTTEEKHMSVKFRSYILNFVKFGAPTSQNEWPRFDAYDKNILEICDVDLGHLCKKNIRNDVAFWTQYLPRLSETLLNYNRYSERVVGDQGEARLKGGVFAMCGLAIILLLLLLASGVLLHKRRSYRPSSVDSQIAY